MANPQAVRAAVGRLVDAYGFALSPNFVTVSTVGPSPAAIARCVCGWGWGRKQERSHRVDLGRLCL